MNEKALDKYVGESVEAEIAIEDNDTFFVKGVLHCDWDSRNGQPLNPVDYTIEAENESICVSSTRIRGISLLKKSA